MRHIRGPTASTIQSNKSDIFFGVDTERIHPNNARVDRFDFVGG